MSQSPFQKYVNPKKNSVIKEELKQAKKKAKKERAEAINKRFEEKRRQKREALEAAQQAKSDKQPADGGMKTAAGKQRITTRTAANSRPSATEKRETTMPLNKYLAHCGICSRRDAAELVKKGEVKVNNKIILEPAFKVSSQDDIVYNNRPVFITKNLVYLLLNKPKDYLTTTDDPQGRKTVLQLTRNATAERIYPVGRLDRNTSGVLLLTNDGALAQQLSHPSYEVKKVYEARLDKPLTKNDFDKILSGLTLEDGPVKADALGYVDARDKSVIGIEIHSGRNRIVRRIFEHLGYEVKGLDRVMYAGLTKKNVPRGKWRFLSEKEIRLLKYLNKSKVPKHDKA